MEEGMLSPVVRRVTAAALCVFVALLASFEQRPGGDGEGEAVAQAAADDRPNIVFILTDDLEANSKSEKHMDRLQGVVKNQGTTFTNAFIPDSLCCPSRAAILTGDYTHNHEIRGNRLPNGGFEKFRDLGHESDTFATWLQDSGYRTFYAGKYFNQYKNTNYVPPGWDRWFGATKNDYYGFELNQNGKSVSYEGRKVYQTDLLTRKATGFIGNMEGRDEPFLAYLAPKAPHRPAEAAPRHRDMFKRAKAPRTESFNEKNVSDKPEWVRSKPRLTRSEVRELNDINRDRMRSMMAVDDMIKQVVRELRRTGELNNTYIVFTSDNGYHLGEHRLADSKWTPYEESIKVPFVVRGPGVPAGEVRRHMIVNNDFAPTFADWAQARVPEPVDGRSIDPLLDENPPRPKDWRTAFIMQSNAHGQFERPYFEGVRTHNWSYTEYRGGEKELYNLKRDSQQLNNIYDSASPGTTDYLQTRLDSLRGCSGEECHEAEKTGNQP